LGTSNALIQNMKKYSYNSNFSAIFAVFLVFQVFQHECLSSSTSQISIRGRARTPPRSMPSWFTTASTALTKVFGRHSAADASHDISDSLPSWWSHAGAVEGWVKVEDRGAVQAPAEESDEDNLTLARLDEETKRAPAGGEIYVFWACMRVV
jgi:hypothetical protein